MALGMMYKTNEETIAEKDRRIRIAVDMYNACYVERADFSDALDLANSNINDAKAYAWESYEDMGDALDYLEEVYP